MANYQLIITGTCMAGIPAMQKANQLGIKTAVIIGDKFGGACLNNGCMQNKVKPWLDVYKSKILF